MRVRLAPALRPLGESLSPVPPLFEADGPQVILGELRPDDGLAQPIAATPHSLFGPRGALLCGAGGPLWVCDTGHHRLLGWSALPDADGAAADWVIGQVDAFHEGRNGKGLASSASLNVPTGIARCGAGMAVADAWNHRILIWHDLPRRNNAAADLVLGQADFAATDANRGAPAPSAGSLFWPYGVHWDGARLWVADSGNRRVLMWDGMPATNGQPADLVLGQPDFSSRNENGGGAPGAASMRWPHTVYHWQDRLLLADAGNNRIMVWSQLPETDNTACNFVLGQGDFSSVDHNRALYWPNAGSLNMPYGVAAAGNLMIVADTANSRLLGWHADACTAGGPAQFLAGQPDFRAKGDNRWQLPARDSFCWPYAAGVHGDRVVVADSGNNRISIWCVARSELDDSMCQ
ncbi:MAG: hypothetical protein KF778_06485 [Rhodocyclaceae bacterium]|nr:hypothetical protein [Rhodocyclaceae bacterium]MBX3668033.1 hypothetical protein [Rhodocyclaceae bacterium]